MPNNVKNRLIIEGNLKQVKDVFDKYNTFYPAEIRRASNNHIICKSRDGSNFGWYNEKTGEFLRINEETVIGLPEDYEFEISQAFNHFPDFNKIKPQPENIFNDDLSSEDEEKCKKEGRPTWCDWNRENWGTKWNSYSCDNEGLNIFTFETAWNGIPDLILEMSKQNPEVLFRYEYADKDTGYNCGIYEFKNGDIIKNFLPEEGSKEAYELSFLLRPEIRGDYEYNGITYECK